MYAWWWRPRRYYRTEYEIDPATGYMEDLPTTVIATNRDDFFAYLIANGYTT